MNSGDAGRKECEYHKQLHEGECAIKQEWMLQEIGQVRPVREADVSSSIASLPSKS